MKCFQNIIFLTMSETENFFSSNLLTENISPQKSIAPPPFQVKWMLPNKNKKQQTSKQTNNEIKTQTIGILGKITVWKSVRQLHVYSYIFCSSTYYVGKTKENHQTLRINAWSPTKSTAIALKQRHKTKNIYSADCTFRYKSKQSNFTQYKVIVVLCSNM